MLQFTHTPTQSIAFRDTTSLLAGQYLFSPDLPKPCFHPLTTAKGRTVTLFQPSDHAWHRGLWFAIKFINGTNFWEESPPPEPPFGIQQTSAEPHALLSSPTSFTIIHKLQWTSPATGPVIDESRHLTISITPENALSIAWASLLMPLQDLTLDRTPYTTWGGYSGLTFRAARELHNPTYLLPDGSTKAPLLGEQHPEITLRAQVDGGPHEFVSIKITSDQNNPHSSPHSLPHTPWYAKADPNYTFLNAAFLFHAPMQVKKSAPLRFHHTLTIEDTPTPPP